MTRLAAQPGAALRVELQPSRLGPRARNVGAGQTYLVNADTTLHFIIKKNIGHFYEAREQDERNPRLAIAPANPHRDDGKVRRGAPPPHTPHKRARERERDFLPTTFPLEALFLSPFQKEWRGALRDLFYFAPGIGEGGR